MPPDRIEREIEEILDKIDRFVPNESVPVRFRRRASGIVRGVRDALLSPLARVSIAQVMLLGVALFFLAFFLGRFDPALGKWTAVAGAVLFVGGFLLSLLGGRGRHEPKRWRGRVVQYEEPDLPARLRTWLRARRSHRPPPPR